MLKKSTGADRRRIQLMTQPQAQQQPAAQQNPESTSQEGVMLPPADNQVTLPTDKVTVINVDEIKPNSILIINVDVDSPVQKMAIAPVFGKLLSPYTTKLREKGVTVMLMSLHENINLISEEEMNKAGWEKKTKSLIINPFQK